MSASGGDPEARLRRSWDANAAAWSEAVTEGRIASRRAGSDHAILQAVREHAPRRVLDAGCGEGWLARALGDAGIEVVGFDGSAELVRRARSMGGGEFVHAGYEEVVRNPGLAGGFYDAVVCNFSLLGRDPAPILEALASRLAPEGRLLVQTVHPWVACGDAPYADGWRTEGWQGFGDAFSEPMPWYFRTLASWSACLASAGLVVREVREPVHPQTHRPLSLLLVAVPLPRPGHPAPGRL